MGKRHPKLCPHDIEQLRSWESQLNAAEEKHLTYEGNDELLQLAERVQNRFPSLLPDRFSKRFYKVSLGSMYKSALLRANGTKSLNSQTLNERQRVSKVLRQACLEGTISVKSYMLLHRKMIRFYDFTNSAQNGLLMLMIIPLPHTNLINGWWVMRWAICCENWGGH